jgi:hypothetical protein
LLNINVGRSQNHSIAPLLRFDIAFLREVAATLKDFDFVLIPLVFILTSAPIKKSMFASTVEHNHKN